MKGSIIHDLPSYDRYLGGKGGIDIGYPWLSIGALVALDQTIFNPDTTEHVPKRVLEFGSGGSTVYFARRAEFVRSIETDEKWALMAQGAIERHGLAHKVELSYCTNVESEEVVTKLPDNSFDLMLVDHAADKTVVGRSARRKFSRLPLCLIGLPKLKTTGFLVIDNYAMHGCENIDLTGWNVYLFDDLRYSGRGTLIARRTEAGRILRPKR